MTYKPNIAIVHSDLDGLGCQLVLKSKFNDIFYMNIHHNEVIQTLIDLEENLKVDRNKQNIIFGDLSLGLDEFKIIKRIVEDNKNITFIFADHHIRTKELSQFIKDIPSNFIDLYDIKRSSASILLYYFNVQHKYLRELIDIINIYDLWVTKDEKFKESLIINELYESVGHRVFFDNIQGFKLNDYLLNKYNKILNKVDKFIISAPNNQLIYTNDKICLAHLDNYKSIIQYYFNRDIVIFISSNLNFSFRLSNNLKDYEIDDITKKFFMLFERKGIIYYHAHKQVFGFNSTPEHLNTDIDDLIMFIQENFN